MVEFSIFLFLLMFVVGSVVLFLGVVVKCGDVYNCLWWLYMSFKDFKGNIVVMLIVFMIVLICVLFFNVVIWYMMCMYCCWSSCDF